MADPLARSPLDGCIGPMGGPFAAGVVLGEVRLQGKLNLRGEGKDRLGAAFALARVTPDDDARGRAVRVLVEALSGGDARDAVYLLHRLGERAQDATLTAPAYAQSAKPEHVEQLKDVMGCLLRLLARCGVHTDSARVRAFPTRRSASSCSSPPSTTLPGIGEAASIRGSPHWARWPRWWLPPDRCCPSSRPCSATTGT